MSVKLAQQGCHSRHSKAEGKGSKNIGICILTTLRRLLLRFGLL
jgi:hypothetical protein